MIIAYLNVNANDSIVLDEDEEFLFFLLSSFVVAKYRLHCQWLFKDWCMIWITSSCLARKCMMLVDMHIVKVLTLWRMLSQWDAEKCTWQFTAEAHWH